MSYDELVAENAQLRELLSAERQNNDELRLALDIMAEPTIAMLARFSDPAAWMQPNNRDEDAVSELPL